MISITKWFRKMDRHLWIKEMLVGCQIALKSFFKSEDELKAYEPRARRYEGLFREIERDHRILIHRTLKMQDKLGECDDIEFTSFQEDFYDKIRSVRGKFIELAQTIRSL